MATRQERMRDRMRGAGKHNVGDVDFGFIIPVAEDPDEPSAEDEDASPPAPTPPQTRPTPNTSAKRIHRDRDASRPSPTSQSTTAPPEPTVQRTTDPDVYSLPDHTTEGDESAHPRPPPSTTTTALLDQSPTLPRSRPSRHSPRSQTQAQTEPEDNDHDNDQPMPDAPAPLSSPTATHHHRRRHQQHQRGPLSSVISATKRLSFDPSSPSSSFQAAAAAATAAAGGGDEMEVTESPADAPGSGRRRRLRPAVGPGTPVAGSSVLLQKVLEEEGRLEELDGGDGGVGGGSSPVERRVARVRRRSEVLLRTGRGTTAGGSPVGGGERRGTRLSAGSSVAETAVGVDEVEEGEEVVEDEEEVMEEEEVVVEESTIQPDEEEEQVAEEVGEAEAAKMLGRKRPRRSLPAPSPELGSGVAEESPAPKRRRRREAASPAQQQQPAKKARVRPATNARPSPQPEPLPQPQAQAKSKGRPSARARSPRPAQPEPEVSPDTQAKPKGRPKKQARKSRTANGEDAEPGSNSVPVTIQRFTKPPRVSNAADGEDQPDADVLNGEIPFANRGGVNAIDVLSKLCEELVEMYMDKLEARARAAEDAATRREQKTMYRALQAFQEEVRTRLLEHVSASRAAVKMRSQTIALDNFHALRKRVRAAQKEKLTLRDEILRIRAEREQVALRMDAIRIRHEADSKEALRTMSLSSAMHDIDLAVEKGQAAPELSPAEQKKADLANLELLISRVADQASSRSQAGGTLKQIKEFNAFLERAAAVLEGR
ncbi:hypothetical protein NEMBOFW57_002996 [Staphylotrichum longicolle]|uniref:Inner kinetochore subunit AME1 domain-containing protein n=1 Tax=Staphylotrichum longicolle TaxID=669026 RepID=A0AAD4I2Y1_9PEZI|nr:hypothetical protein NEMBOFW57_002996 [Staphylotrichum longicolle]